MSASRAGNSGAPCVPCPARLQPRGLLRAAPANRARRAGRGGPVLTPGRVTPCHPLSLRVPPRGAFVLNAGRCRSRVTLVPVPCHSCVAPVSLLCCSIVTPRGGFVLTPLLCHTRVPPRGGSVLNPGLCHTPVPVVSLSVPPRGEFVLTALPCPSRVPPVSPSVTQCPSKEWLCPEPSVPLSVLTLLPCPSPVPLRDSSRAVPPFGITSSRLRSPPRMEIWDPAQRQPGKTWDSALFLLFSLAGGDRKWQGGSGKIP